VTEATVTGTDRAAGGAIRALYAEMVAHSSGFYGYQPRLFWPDGSEVVTFRGTAEDPPAGFPLYWPIPLSGPVEYIPVETQVWRGFRIMVDATIDIDSAGRFGGVSTGTSTSITVTVRRNGTIISSQTQTDSNPGVHFWGDMVYFALSGIDVAADDTIEMGVSFANWAGFEYYASIPADGFELSHFFVMGETRPSAPLLRGHVTFAAQPQSEEIDMDLLMHVAADDPHVGYQKESEKGAANGYAGLGAGGLVPVAQLASGTPNGTKFVRDDGTLVTPAGTHPDLATHDALGLATDSALSDHAGAADPHTGYVLESLIDAAGDLIVGTADNTAGRLAKGADGQVLTTDPATHLLIWATPTGGSALTVEEADGTPTDSAITKIVFPNGTLEIVAHVATYTPGASSGAIAEALIDAKGDLIVGSAADTAARLAVGATTGHVLTVDSGETLGVKWAAADGGGGSPADVAASLTTAYSLFR